MPAPVTPVQISQANDTQHHVSVVANHGTPKAISYSFNVASETPGEAIARLVADLEAVVKALLSHPEAKAKPAAPKKAAAAVRPPTPPRPTRPARPARPAR